MAGAGLELCRGCGAEVVYVLCQAGAEPTNSGQWGVPVPFERLMTRGRAGQLGIRQHHCRDYLDWHRTRADNRGVDEREEDGPPVVVQAPDQGVRLPWRGRSKIVAAVFALCR